MYGEEGCVPTDSSESEGTHRMVPGDASSDDDFLVQKFESKKVDNDECQDQKKGKLRCCYQEFQSELELEGHLRIHGQHRSKSLCRKNKEVGRRNYPHQDDDVFRCLVCDDSFTTIQLLLLHTRNHTSEEERLSDEPQTSVEEQQIDQNQNQNQNQESWLNMLKHSPKFSKTDEKGRKRAANGDIISCPQPLSVNFPPVEETVKDSHDSNTANNIPTLSLGFQTQNNFPNFSHGKLKSHKANSDTVKNAHQCEICCQTFETGQALGGHKTYHRNEQPSDGSSRPRGLLTVRRKSKEQLPAEIGIVRQTSNLTSIVLPGPANSSEESYQEHSQFQTQNTVPNLRHGGLKSHKSANPDTVKSVHQCEICGKTFEKGQALGGHKTYHRNKRLSNAPFRPRGLLIVDRKAEQQLPAEISLVRETTSNLTKMFSPGKTNSSEESNQEHSPSKKVLDFDLNIPYVEE